MIRKGRARVQAEGIRKIALAHGIPLAVATAYFRRLLDVPIPINIKVGALQAAQGRTEPGAHAHRGSPARREAESTLSFDGIGATEKRRELVRLHPDRDEHVARRRSC
jgi:hypothetical protein